MTGIQPTFCITCTVWPTSTTSTQVIITPVTISIFLCGSLRSSAIDEEEDRDDRGEADRDALEHRPGARLERQRLQEQRRLEALAVDAREPERDEADDLCRSEREPGSGEDRLLPPVEVLEILLPVDPVVEPVEDQQEHGDRDERDDSLELLAVAGERAEHRLGNDPRERARDEREPTPTRSGRR